MSCRMQGIFVRPSVRPSICLSVCSFIQLLPMAQVNKANEPSWLPHNLSKISSWKLVSLTLSICRLINIWQYLRWFGNTTYTRKSILLLIHKLQYRDCGAQSCIHQIVKLPLLEKQKGLGVWGLGGLLGLSGLGGKGARLGCPGWQAKEAWPGG